RPALARSRGFSIPAPAAPARRRPREYRPPLRVRLRRILALSLLLVLADVGWSFMSALSRPSNVGIGVRAVEWLRDNGAAWFVSDVEGIYYSLGAPSTGGPGLKTLPAVGVGVRAATSSYRPPPIAPVIRPP